MLKVQNYTKKNLLIIGALFILILLLQSLVHHFLSNDRLYYIDYKHPVSGEVIKKSLGVTVIKEGDTATNIKRQINKYYHNSTLSKIKLYNQTDVDLNREQLMRLEGVVDYFVYVLVNNQAELQIAACTNSLQSKSEKTRFEFSNPKFSCYFYGNREDYYYEFLSYGFNYNFEAMRSFADNVTVTLENKGVLPAP